MNGQNHLARNLLPLGEEIAQLPISGHRATLTVDPTPVSVALRQISGITAGATLALSVGRTGLGPNPTTVGFEVFVDGNGHVEIEARDVPLRLDGEPVRERTAVGDAIIDTGCARFVIERTVPTLGRRRGHRIEAVTADSPIMVPERTDHPTSDAFDAELMRRVLEARRRIIARQRRRYPDPVELLAIAGKSRDIQRFGSDATYSPTSVCIAHADVVWQPRFNRVDRLPTTSAQFVDDLRMLVAACVTADFGLGPLAIVGRPNARRAVARHLMISLAIRHEPPDLDMAVVATRDHAHHWSWADALPHTNPNRESTNVIPLLIIDGAEQLEDTLAGELVNAGGAHAVILANQAKEISLSCAMTMIIADDATASVIDHRTGETLLRATPLGFAEPVAAEAAARIHEAERHARPLAANRL